MEHNGDIHNFIKELRWRTSTVFWMNGVFLCVIVDGTSTARSVNYCTAERLPSRLVGKLASRGARLAEDEEIGDWSFLETTRTCFGCIMFNIVRHTEPSDPPLHDLPLPQSSAHLSHMTAHRTIPGCRARLRLTRVQHLPTPCFILSINIEHPDNSESREFPPSTSSHVSWTVCHPRGEHIYHELAPKPIARRLPSQKQQIPVTTDHSKSILSTHSSFQPPAPFSAKASPSESGHEKMCTAQSSTLLFKVTVLLHHSRSCLWTV